MKKICFALMCMASLAIVTACGGKSGGSASGSESSGNASGLADGKWPAAVYAKYGIPELATKGKVVFTEFANDGDELYKVYFNDVTKEELLAWVKGLTDKGFRMSAIDREHLNSSWNEVLVFQPEEMKDVALGIQFDFKEGMSFDYWDDNPNPAFTYEEGAGTDGANLLRYNTVVKLRKLDNQAVAEGSLEPLNLKAEELAGIPGVRAITLDGKADASRMSGRIQFYRDHQMKKEDINAAYDKLADVLAVKGATFFTALGGESLTVEKMKADGIHAYQVELSGKRYLLINPSLDGPREGDFGGSLILAFNIVGK